MQLRNDRAEERRAEAEERKQARLTMTPAEKLASLDRIHGKGLGAKAERARLAAKLSGK